MRFQIIAGRDFLGGEGIKIPLENHLHLHHRADSFAFMAVCFAFKAAGFRKETQRVRVALLQLVRLYGPFCSAPFRAIITTLIDTECKMDVKFPISFGLSRLQLTLMAPYNTKFTLPVLYNNMVSSQ